MIARKVGLTNNDLFELVTVNKHGVIECFIDAPVTMAEQITKPDTTLLQMRAKYFKIPEVIVVVLLLVAVLLLCLLCVRM